MLVSGAVVMPAWASRAVRCGRFWRAFASPTRRSQVMILHIACGQLAGIGAIAEGHGMKALASAAHIDAHHSARGGSPGTGVHVQGLWIPIGIRSTRS